MCGFGENHSKSDQQSHIHLLALGHITARDKEWNFTNVLGGISTLSLSNSNLRPFMIVGLRPIGKMYVTRLPFISPI